VLDVVVTGGALFWTYGEDGRRKSRDERLDQQGKRVKKRRAAIEVPDPDVPAIQYGQQEV